MALQAMTQAQRIASLTRLASAGGPLNGLVLHLSNSLLLPRNGMVRADFPDITVDGYAAVVAIALGVGYIGPDGKVHLTAPSEDFICSGLTNPAQSVTIAMLCKADAVGPPVVPGDVVYAWQLSPPVTFGEFVGQGFSLDIDLTEDMLLPVP